MTLQRFGHTAIALLLAALGGVCAGGEIVTFQPGRPLPAPVLEHLPMRAVVAEFVDPEQSSIGKELSYLVWREILTAISDQRGAGVILARTPGGARVADLLKTDYHEAALRIATAQGARMAVWGAVDQEEGAVHIATYLSMLGDAKDSELALRLKTSRADTGLGARITRTKFNFPVVVHKREGLFSRWVVTRAGAKVMAEPGAGRVIETPAAGTALQATDMRDEWFAVRLPSGRNGYIGVGNVDLPPRGVSVAAGQDLWAEPRAASGRAGRTDSTIATVVDMRYVPQTGLWYRVRFANQTGWIHANRARALFTLPMIHFVAGLYRYQLGRWDDAVREFETYVQSPGARTDNASLSTAYQLLGASRLMLASSKGGDVTGAKGWEDDFARALTHTPFDPAIYTLRAVAQTAVKRNLEGVSADLEKALELDPSNGDARNVTVRIDAYVKGQASPLRDMGVQSNDQQRRQVRQLTDKYRLESVPR